MAFQDSELSQRPRSEWAGKHFLAAFAIALLIYGVAYFGIEHLRTRKGGWQVNFTSDALGVPGIEVRQAQLAIQEVKLLFPEQRLSQTNLSQLFLFDRPHTNVPFGKVVYFDTTFLPGSLVLDVFGHEIEFIPRALLVDHREIPWSSARTIVLSNAPGTTGSGRPHL